MHSPHHEDEDEYDDEDEHDDEDDEDEEDEDDHDHDDEHLNWFGGNDVFGINLNKLQVWNSLFNVEISQMVVFYLMKNMAKMNQISIV